ncbi:MAG: RNA polymerase sigma factor [Acidimicrobiia bacterium]
MNETDLDLASRARKGDPEAFGELVSRATPRLLRMAQSILGARASAEDAVQDGVTAAWRGIDGFRGDAAFSTWLHRIVVRACLQQLRNGRPAFEDVEGLEEAEHRFMDPDYTVDPAEVAARLSDAQELRRALDGLPAVYRVAVVLHDADGLTALEVAEVTGVPLGTAKARIRRGRIALLAELARRGTGRAGDRRC